MARLSIFERDKWGTGLPERVESIGRSSFDVARPQLFLIRDLFFTENAAIGPQALSGDSAWVFEIKLDDSNSK